MEITLNRGLKIKITKAHIVCLIVLFALNIPGALIEATTIYHTEYQYAMGDFARLNYNLNIFEAFLIIWAFLLLRRKSNNISFYWLFIIILLKDIIFLLIGKQNVFSLHSYEMYFCLLIGLASCDIVCKETRDDLKSINYFLDLLIIFNFAYQVLFLLMGVIKFGDRVNAISMGYGAVGFLCASHILYTLLIREKSKWAMIMVIICFISMLLSGSRYSLLITIIGILLFNVYIFKSASRRIRWLLVGVLLVVSVFLTMIIVNPAFATANPLIERIVGLFQNGNFLQNISNDESFLGRVISIQAGFAILGDNPIGIANSFIDIQGKTIENGFFSFPHSNFLTFYLLWGIPLIACIIWLIKECVIAFKSGEKGIAYFLIIFIITNTIYGGAETAPKVYTYIFCVMSIVKIKLDSRRRKLVDY